MVRPRAGEYLYAGHAQQLRHGAAYIVDARRHYGHPVAADPGPVAVPVVEQPAAPKPGDVARYCGSLAELRGQLVRVEFCDCDADDCAGYRAEPLDTELPGAVHVRSTSFAVEPV
ncbi:hypothetical protein GXW82_23440 [Streptacidiphilus sp. 4-A2]|nr:hypothetical protein [Streptacidiphilus sp. 4-A2]